MGGKAPEIREALGRLGLTSCWDVGSWGCGTPERRGRIIGAGGSFAKGSLSRFKVQGRRSKGYERLMRGEFDELRNFHGIGRLLIAARIAKSVSQGELADRLGVH
jgi:hypothetical protein